VAVIGYGTTTRRKRKGTPPYDLSNKRENKKQEKIRKTHKSKVKVFRLKRAIGVKKQKASKKPLMIYKN